MAAYYQGLFRPKNIDKYVGDSTKIVFRSSWELRAMKFFDEHPSILKWGSEELPIPYVSPVDNKLHRYFVDFIVKYRDNKGLIKKMMVEVKPSRQTRPPENTGRNKRRYLNEMVTYAVNDAKWRAAKAFGAAHGMEFVIITEKELFSDGQ